MSYDLLMEKLQHHEQRFDEVLEALHRGGDRFARMTEQLDELQTAVEPLPQMQADIAKTKKVVEAYALAENAGKFVKWSAGIIVAVTAAGASIKLALIHVFKGG